MSYDDRLGDYVDVPTRIAEFREKHPEGSLQPANPDKVFEVIEVAGATFIVYVAAAYRTPDDPRPGIGAAWEPVPGRTPYTRNSELMNAETSAWGRAIIAALAADAKKGIASQHEVRNRQAEREAPEPQWEQPPPPPVTDAVWFDRFPERIDAATTEAELKGLWEELLMKGREGQVTDDDGAGLEAHIKNRKAELEGQPA